ncbi:MAG: hypothetical protein KIT82_21225 [Bradyrhizobium sp.]|nr:hypothetical protein [Bradyrhizobium sp.]
MKVAWLAAAIWLVCGQAASTDQFRKVRCGADIPKALIGQRSANDNIVTLEGRNRALGLKHLGADEISDRLSSINYLICGSEFVLLEDRQGVVRDVIPFPAHSRQSPAFSGICQINGREQRDAYIGVLNGEGTGKWLPVVAAWKIDEKGAKFVKAAAEGLSCARSGIFTVDGGM